jgi:hypothetical protein
MTIELPHALTEPLGWIGMIWPEADEDKLFADGKTWIEYGAKLRTQAQKANEAARQAWTRTPARRWRPSSGRGTGIRVRATTSSRPPPRSSSSGPD